MIEEKQDSIEVKEPVIGDFKPKDKFIEFIGAKGNINFISNEATIEAKYLSGLDMDGIVLKLTICDEGTVNLDEVDTNFTTKEQRGRLLEIISEKTITPARGRMVITELPFESVKKVGDKSMRLYLSVDYQKPIEKLASLLDDEDISISDEQSSKLDALMSMFDDEPSLAEMLFQSETDEELARELEGESDEEIEVISSEPIYDHKKQMEESFVKMKQEKIDDLNKRLSNKKKELVKFTQDMKLSTKKVGDTEDEIKLLESRLETLEPESQFTGYYFNVSERLNEKVNLEPEIAELIKSKISKVKSINVEAFMKLFEDGEYQIRLGAKSMDVVGEITDYETLSEEAQKALSKLGVKMSDGKLIYMGDMNWGDIINKMIKLGFSQDSEFDKHCGSNSYKAAQYGKVDTTTQSVDKEEDEEVESESVETQFKELVSFDAPTDIVIYGNYDDIGTQFQITDDESGFVLQIGDKKVSLSSTGFGSVVTLEEYKNLYSQKGEEMSEYSIVDGIVIPNFQGTIGIAAENEEGKIISDIDLSDYIEHQAPENEYYNVIVNIPGSYKAFKLNEDLSLPLDVIRDIKIDNIIK